MLNRLLNHDLFNTVLLRLISAGISLVITVLISRNFGVEIKGVYVYILSIASLLGVFYLTIHHASVALVKEYGSDKVISTSFFLYSILTVLTLLVLGLVYISTDLINLSSEFIYILIFLFPMAYFNTLANTYYQIKNELVKYNYLLVFSRLLLLLLVFICIYFNFSINSIFIVLVFAFIVIAYKTIKRFKDIIFNNFDLKIIKNFIKASMMIHISTIATLALNDFNSYYIGTYLTKYDLGLYDALLQISGILILVASGVVPVVFSRGINEEKKKFIDFIITLNFIVFVIVLLLSIILNNFSENIISFLFGKDFVTSSQFIHLMLFQCILQIIILLIAPLWIINNKLKSTSVIMGVIACIHIFLFIQIKPNSINDIIMISIISSLILAIINISYLIIEKRKLYAGI